MVFSLTPHFFLGIPILIRTIFCTHFDRKLSQLTEIPLNIPNDTTRVNLFDNDISTIKKNSFLYLDLCTDIDLSKNNISQIQTGGFQGLSSLLRLHLEYNSLKVLNNGIWKGLQSLRILYLNKNKISAIQDGTFHDITKLENLWLDSNNLVALRMDMFLGLTSLQELHLDHNKLSQIQQHTFLHVPNLWALTLANNTIGLIEANAFSNLSKLKLLYMDQNNLTTLQWTIFDVKGHTGSDPLPLAIELTLNDNPFQCDHSLCWLKPAGLTNLGIECAHPENTSWNNPPLECTDYSKCNTFNTKNSVIIASLGGLSPPLYYAYCVNIILMCPPKTLKKTKKTVTFYSASLRSVHIERTSSR